jgi:predicted RNase H-like nuclease (RuvC/YqgF family)
MEKIQANMKSHKEKLEEERKSNIISKQKLSELESEEEKLRVQNENLSKKVDFFKVVSNNLGKPLDSTPEDMTQAKVLSPNLHTQRIAVLESKLALKTHTLEDLKEKMRKVKIQV